MLVPCCGSATLWVVLFFGSKPPGCVAMALWLFGWNKTGTWSINGRKGQASASHHPELDSKSLVSYIQKKTSSYIYPNLCNSIYLNLESHFRPFSIHFHREFFESEVAWSTANCCTKAWPGCICREIWEFHSLQPANMWDFHRDFIGIPWSLTVIMIFNDI